MESLYETVVDIQRKNAQKKRDEHAILFEDMEHLFDAWVHGQDVEKRIMEAAERGETNTELAQFQRSELFRSSPVLLMTLGPAKDRAFFARMGEISLLDRLRIHFHPFYVRHWFDRETDTNHVSIGWDETVSSTFV